MSKIGYQILGALTSFFAFTSVIASCYIIFGAIKVRRSLIGKPAKNRPLFVIQHVLFMSICDVFQQLWLGFVWLPIGFDSDWNADWNWFSCSLWGSFGQFFLIASASWNFIIALCLLRMLRATPMYVLEQEIKYHHLFVWSIATICCIAPWIGNSYGYTKNIELKYGFANFECWIEERSYQLCLYLPCMVYVFFALILVIFTIIKSGRIKRIKMSLRLIAYTMVFILTWAFPIYLRLRGAIMHTSAPHWAVWAHHLGLASIGIGNALIWGTGGHINGGNDSKSKLKLTTNKSKSKSKLSKSKSTKSSTVLASSRDITSSKDIMKGSEDVEFCETDKMKIQMHIKLSVDSPSIANDKATSIPPTEPITPVDSSKLQNVHGIASNSYVVGVDDLDQDDE